MLHKSLNNISKHYAGFFEIDSLIIGSYSLCKVEDMF